MTGAAILAASAALRAGAGLVRVTVPGSVLPIVAAGNPCYTTVALSEDEAGRINRQAGAEIEKLGSANDVMAIGPGLGQGEEITETTIHILSKVQIPVVLDADGLNALVGHLHHLSKHACPLVLTPHPGEFARLLNTDVKTVQERRVELATQFAAENQVILVLKGHGTLVTDGRQLYRNTTGNPGMATGGTGDVLTGVIAALIGQKLEPFAAAQLGVYLHGLAGDLARKQYGEVSLIATDLIEFLPRAFLHS